jgi:hypothetical protein
MSSEWHRCSSLPGPSFTNTTSFFSSTSVPYSCCKRRSRFLALSDSRQLDGAILEWYNQSCIMVSISNKCTLSDIYGGNPTNRRHIIYSQDISQNLIAWTLGVLDKFIAGMMRNSDSSTILLHSPHPAQISASANEPGRMVSRSPEASMQPHTYFRAF